MRVLLATDGSEDARAAVAWLGALPLPADTELRVITAVSVPPSALDIPTVRDFQASLRDEAHRLAEQARAALAPRCPGISAHVGEGDPREVILRATEEWPADLVVLGARGLGAVAGFLLGSVSLGVARHARASVLVVKAGGAVPPRGALVALDGSANAAAAAAFLARLPLDPTFTVRLLGVVERPRAPATTPAFAAKMIRQAIAQIVAERRTEIERAQATAAAALAGAVKRVEQQVVVGRPIDEIVGAAARPDVDLVVVGARGLGALQRVLLGSVSEGVLRHVHRPVLIVKTTAR
jgi:nucleotide-binding universal stress UspA family protein